MENIKEFYFLGEPIDTEIGTAHFVKIKEYPELIKYSPYLNLEKFEVLNLIKEINEEYLNELSDIPFVVLIKELSSVFEIYDMYKDLFSFIFKEDVFDRIETDEQLETYKQLIREMNCINFEKKNPNPEIERFNQLKKLYNKSKSSGEISLESMITSVWVSMGCDVFNLTIYQLYALFNRISQFKSYDTTVLYNSVSGQVPIEIWFKHIDMFNKPPETISIDEIQDYASKLMS